MIDDILDKLEDLGFPSSTLDWFPDALLAGFSNHKLMVVVKTLIQDLSIFSTGLQVAVDTSNTHKFLGQLHSFLKEQHCPFPFVRRGGPKLLNESNHVLMVVDFLLSELEACRMIANASSPASSSSSSLPPSSSSLSSCSSSTTTTSTPTTAIALTSSSEGASPFNLSFVGRNDRSMELSLSVTAMYSSLKQILRDDITSASQAIKGLKDAFKHAMLSLPPSTLKPALIKKEALSKKQVTWIAHTENMYRNSHACNALSNPNMWFT